jgi:hypothetical protein
MKHIKEGTNPAYQGRKEGSTPRKAGRKYVKEGRKESYQGRQEGSIPRKKGRKGGEGDTCSQPSNSWVAEEAQTRKEGRKVRKKEGRHKRRKEQKKEGDGR